MKTKILLIPVGGTICTAIGTHGTLEINKKSGGMLKDNFERSDSLYAKNVDFTLTKNLGILSENMTVDAWNKIAKQLKKQMKKNYDGIIIAHGTDTLAFTAAVFSILFHDTDTPIFFVSSNKKLTDKDSNGNRNFKAAVELICKGITPNVYVTYQNPSNNKLYLHLASRLTQCPNYSEDFNSVGAIDVTDDLERALKVLEDNYPKTHTDFNLNKINLKNNVLYLNPYVGINYKAYKLNKFKAILHGTYHSGTANTELANLKHKDIYLSPSIPEGEVYDTVRIIAQNKNINFLYGMTNEMAYAKLLVAYSVFKNKNDIKTFLETEINYEFIEK